MSQGVNQSFVQSGQFQKNVKIMVVGNNGTQLKPNVFDMPKTTKNNLVTKFYC